MYVPVLIQVAPMTLSIADHGQMMLPCMSSAGSTSPMALTQGSYESLCGMLPCLGSGVMHTMPMSDMRTTLVLSNLPMSLSQVEVQHLLDSRGLRGSYDFLYMPWNFEDHVSVGYALVNFITHAHARDAWLILHGFNSWNLLLRKTLERPCAMFEVTWSKTSQGIESNIERYRNSPVMHQSVPEELRPMMFNKGVFVPFPSPAKRLRPPRALFRLQRAQEVQTLVRPGVDLREGIQRVVRIINIADMAALFTHLDQTLAVEMTYSSPGVCDKLHDARQVVTFHKRLREAIPDLHLTLDHVSLDSWRATATGKQVKALIPHLPVGSPIKFTLESRVRIDHTGKVSWVCEKFELLEDDVTPDTKGEEEAKIVEVRNDNEVKHQSGDCQPCAYFAFKSFKCSKGNDCEFCHLCTKSKARKRKRVKAVQLKLQQVEETIQDLLAVEDKMTLSASAEESLSFSSVSTEATSASMDDFLGDEDGWVTDDGF